jgi:DNA mismatch repair protein MutL
MAKPLVGFTLADESRTLLRLHPPAADLMAGGDPATARLARLSAILGRDFADNALAIDAARDGVRLTGFIGLPTLHRATSAWQFLFVNGRPVRDRLLQGAVRGAYQDFLARDRHPMVALFLELPAELVDVNVHPTKAEVRFRDAALVRGLIVGSARHALGAAGHRAATTVADAALAGFRPGGGERPSIPSTGLLRQAMASFAPLPSAAPRGFAEERAGFAGPTAPPPAADDGAPAAAYPLGAARAQLHETYIVAQTADGIVIVDQHAAHERLVYERMKRALGEGGVARQGLLIPEVVELDEAAVARLAARADELAELGLVLEPFGPGAVVVREAPALLGETDLHGLVRDLADELAEWGDTLALKERIETVCGTLACHTSVRAGRHLSPPEMDALLRQMEATPNSGQCNHGRPTYIALDLADIERLFGRR